MTLKECLNRIAFLESRLKYCIQYEEELLKQISRERYNKLIDNDLEEYKYIKTLIQELKNKEENE